MSWPVARLGELAQHRLGKMLDRENNTGLPRRYLRNPNVKWFEFDLTDLQEILVEEKDVSKYEIQDGDVIICEGGEAGRAAIWRGPSEGIIFQKACHRVRVGPQLDARFLVHRLYYDYHTGGLSDYYTGATIKHFTGQDLARYTIPLPPLPEQQRIATILDKADALRRKRKHTIELLDSLMQSIFFDLFGHSDEELVKWGSPVILSDVAEIGSGITKGRKLNGQPTRQIPYLAVANVQDRKLELANVKMIDATESEIARYRLERDDLLLTEGGDPDKLGRGTLWNGEIDEAIHQNHIFRVRITSQSILPLFLNWLVGSSYGKRYFIRVAKQTTGIASINKRQLSEFPTVVPPIELQHRFVRLAKSTAKETRHLMAYASKADALFSSLQHRAFSGQL